MTQPNTGTAPLRPCLRGTFRSVRRVSLLVCGLVVGCSLPTTEILETTVGNDTAHVDQLTAQVRQATPPEFDGVSSSPAPIGYEQLQAGNVDYDDMSLAQVLADGLRGTAVLRDIGGTILRSPDTVTTSVSRQLARTDPLYGTEAALSEFDAQLTASAVFNQNDRIYNNSFFAGGATAFRQQYDDFQTELSKRSATGAYMAVRGVSSFDGNNAPANNFYSAWTSWVEGELRQPLLQGGGLEFNRIAGPGAAPGIYNGILIARLGGDISDTEFELALIDFVSNVENAYWDLYLAYREYAVLKRVVETIEQKILPAVSQQEEIEQIQVRQQLVQLRGQRDQALFGRLINGTQVRNGATGGTLQPGGGLLAAERRLRLLIGRSANDGMIIRPTDEPPEGRADLDWDSSVTEAMQQRPEIRRSTLAVRKSQMQLAAAGNFLNPKLDAVARYRLRGFGDDLIASGNQRGVSSASSLGSLATGDQQEWTLGVELSVPVGFRRAHAAVRHAELNLARQQTVLKEQQREILSNLSGAFTDVERTRVAVRNSLQEYLTTRQYLEVLQAQSAGLNNQRRGEATRMLEAEKRLLVSEQQLFRVRAEYAVALKNIHFEKGSLLDYKDVRIQAMAAEKAAAVESEPAELQSDVQTTTAASKQPPATPAPVTESAVNATAVANSIPDPTPAASTAPRAMDPSAPVASDQKSSAETPGQSELPLWQRIVQQDDARQERLKNVQAGAAGKNVRAISSRAGQVQL